MVEVCKNLFVGAQSDYERKVRGREGWYVIHAAKEPYHRKALNYSGQSAPKSHKEYYFAARKDRLILNLVDAPDVKYISKQAIDAALKEIEVQLNKGNKVFLHCNKGQSRSPGIAFLHMVQTGKLSGDNVYDLFTQFQRIYPNVKLGLGMDTYIRQNWKR